MAAPLPHVPRLWSGCTLVCVATGPSLCRADLDLIVESGHPVVAINNAYAAISSADVLYAADMQWWRAHAHVADEHMPAWKFSLNDPTAKDYRSGLIVLQRTGYDGLELSPTGLRSGGHSGYQAINLGVHLGAAKIVLVGYDMCANGDQHHSYLVGEHADGSHPLYHRRIHYYETMTDSLAAVGVSVVNASRRTAITAFPRVTLANVL